MDTPQWIRDFWSESEKVEAPKVKVENFDDVQDTFVAHLSKFCEHRNDNQKKNDQLKHELSAIKTVVEGLNDKIEELSDDVEKLEDKNKRLNEKNDELSDDVEKLEAKNKRMKKTIKRLVKNKNEMHKKIDRMSVNQVALLRSIREIKRNLLMPDGSNDVLILEDDDAKEIEDLYS